MARPQLAKAETAFQAHPLGNRLNLLSRKVRATWIRRATIFDPTRSAKRGVLGMFSSLEVKVLYPT